MVFRPTTLQCSSTTQEDGPWVSDVGRTDLSKSVLTFVEVELVLASGRELEERDEEVGVVGLLGAAQQVLPRHPLGPEHVREGRVRQSAPREQRHCKTNTVTIACLIQHTHA